MEAFDMIFKALIFHLALAMIVGAMGSLTTTAVKSMLDSQNKIFNTILTVIIVYALTYIIVVVYGKLTLSDMLIVGLYANIGAKGLYESISKLISEPPFKGATGFSYSEYKEMEEKK